MDTIFALASAFGKAGVAVIRISGPESREVAISLCGPVPFDRSGCLKTLCRTDGTFLDQALVMGFAAPNSFTGEDVLELHIHGGEAVIRAVSSELETSKLCRLAEPGEFTRRAHLNGKLDLTQVEGLADLIDAQTEAQRLAAFDVMKGDFKQLVDELRTDLIRAAGLLAAVIDFADEDVPVDVSPEVSDLLTRSMGRIEKELAGYSTSERIRSGFRVAIVGPPNAGKSTLLNHLAGRDAAITSEIAGTTRDTIEVQMDIIGLPVIFIDTAGIRETTDEIEVIGVERALSAAKTADMRVFLNAANGDFGLEQLTHDVTLSAKDDHGKMGERGISGETGHGVDRLVQHIGKYFSQQAQTASFSSRDRHQHIFERAIVGLVSANELVNAGVDHYDIAAEEIRLTLHGLDSIVGRVDVENLLDVVFSSFCVGK